MHHAMLPNRAKYNRNMQFIRLFKHIRLFTRLKKMDSYSDYTSQLRCTMLSLCIKSSRSFAAFNALLSRHVHKHTLYGLRRMIHHMPQPTKTRGIKQLRSLFKKKGLIWQTSNTFMRPIPHPGQFRKISFDIHQIPGTRFEIQLPPITHSKSQHCRDRVSIDRKIITQFPRLRNGPPSSMPMPKDPGGPSHLAYSRWSQHCQWLPDGGTQHEILRYCILELPDNCLHRSLHDEPKNLQGYISLVQASQCPGPRFEKNDSKNGCSRNSTCIITDRTTDWNFTPFKL